MDGRYFLARYQAMGNDMLVVDPGRFALSLTPGRVRLLCHRHAGIGADGLCWGPLPGNSLPTMRFFNPDGSEAEKSGNGLRIFARYLWDEGMVAGRRFLVAMGQEQVPVSVADDAGSSISLELGQLHIDPLPQSVHIAGSGPLTITTATLGNPHCILFQERVTPELAHRLGPILENHPLFPARTNVEFVQVLASQAIRLEIWERGAGYTLSSGTCSSAAAGAAIHAGLCHSPVSVHMAGGTARVSLGPQGEVRHSGPVVALFRAELAPDLVAQLQGEAGSEGDEEG